MLELTGKYTSCKIFNDYVEQEAISQVYSFLNHPAFKNCKTRFMPDIHAGEGAVIGTTVELSDKVIPNVIGVDIGCGMLSYKLNQKDINIPELDDFITKNIPAGFSIRNKKVYIPVTLEDGINEMCNIMNINPDRSRYSVGTLGGGNHFIECGRDEEDYLWITVHTGSRNFGLQIAQFYQDMAKKQRSCEVDLTNVPPKERQQYLEDYRKSQDKIPTGMEYLSGENAKEYFGAMNIAQEYAQVNRHIIMEDIIEYLGAEGDVLAAVESIHNYINFQDNIIRKGAISAYKDKIVIIPWNMRDGLIIGRGLGNPDWNYSAPHGAGRAISRSKAKETVSLEEFEESMKDIYSTSICQSTIDESPMAYKDYKQIEKYLSETVEIIHRVKPIYNFKAK